MEEEEQDKLTDKEEGEKDAELEEERDVQWWRGRQKRDVQTKEKAEQSKDVYEFPVAAITNRHTLSGMK